MTRAHATHGAFACSRYLCRPYRDLALDWLRVPPLKMVGNSLTSLPGLIRVRITVQNARVAKAGASLNPADHFFRQDESMFVVDDDHIAQRQLASPASFQFAVDRHIAFLNGDLGLAPCANQSCGLQELVESNR